jgi:hypothetical protein
MSGNRRPDEVSAKRLTLLLEEGDLRGVVRATYFGRSIVGYKVPRFLLPSLKNKAFLKRAALYFLFGTDDEGQSYLYVGQVLPRKNRKAANQRLNEKDHDVRVWDRAVIVSFANSDEIEGLSATELDWLENQSFKQIDTLRVTVQQKEPAGAPTSREKGIELLEISEAINLMVEALFGVPLFKAKHQIDEPKAIEVSHPPEVRFYLKGEKYDAVGLRADREFVVLNQSRVAPVTNSIPPAAKAAREHYSDFIDSEDCLTENIPLANANQAAGFVTGCSISGINKWKTLEGKTLREIQASEDQIFE